MTSISLAQSPVPLDDIRHHFEASKLGQKPFLDQLVTYIEALERYPNCKVLRAEVYTVGNVNGMALVLSRRLSNHEGIAALKLMPTNAQSDYAGFSWKTAEALDPDGSQVHVTDVIQSLLLEHRTRAVLYSMSDASKVEGFGVKALARLALEPDQDAFRHVLTSLSEMCKHHINSLRSDPRSFTAPRQLKAAVHYASTLCTAYSAVHQDAAAQIVFKALSLIQSPPRLASGAPDYDNDRFDANLLGLTKAINEVAQNRFLMHWEEPYVFQFRPSAEVDAEVEAEEWSPMP